jgi:large subunit ribosomal protein L6
MSRVGKAPITVPAGVDLKIDGQMVTVKGKLGELKEEIHPNITVKIDEGVVTLQRPDDHKDNRAMHGLFRALINNMVVGVSEGYTKELELVGVGYRATNQGQLLDLSLGYSHNIILEVPKDVKLETKMDKGKNPKVILSSHDKHLLGMVTAKIRSLRKVEPYKGKGIRFVGEQIRRKAGKTAAKK